MQVHTIIIVARIQPCVWVSGKAFQYLVNTIWNEYGECTEIVKAVKVRSKNADYQLLICSAIVLHKAVSCYLRLIIYLYFCSSF